MHPYPLLVKNKTLEIGYLNHSRWNAINCIIRPAVVNADFHIFLTYKARINSFPRITRRLDEEDIYMNLNYVDCTVSSTGCIIPYKDRKILPNSFVKIALPQPTATFYSDLTTWTFDVDLLYCPPASKIEEAFQAALLYLNKLQTLLDAHIRYWDTEGRPALSMLSPKEVLIKYGTPSQGA